MVKSDPYINSYGVLKNKLNIKDNEKLKEAESDIVITRIHELFNKMYFEPTKEYFLEIHKYLFSDVYDFAGKYRTVNIFKQEKVLAFESVSYADYKNLDSELTEVFRIVKDTDILSLDTEMLKDYITSLISDLWLIHPFREGNTRTCLVFLRTYLNSFGIQFDINFFKNANTYKYMRDALVASAFSSEIYEKERDYKYLRRIIGDIIDYDIERKNRL